MHTERLSWYVFLLVQVVRDLQAILGRIDDATIFDATLPGTLPELCGELLALSHQVAGRLVGTGELGPGPGENGIIPSDLALPAPAPDPAAAVLDSIATDCRYALRQLGDPHIGRATWSGLNDCRIRALDALQRVVFALDEREGKT
jgi:hypothetical protein